VDFEILGDIAVVETIATGRGIRDLKRLRKNYGKGRWRKVKGIARIRLPNGHVRLAELHWYEAHGIGKRKSNANAIWTNDHETTQISHNALRSVRRQSRLPRFIELHKIYRVLPTKTRPRRRHPGDR
jgi:hypothetical protein